MFIKMRDGLMRRYLRPTGDFHTGTHYMRIPIARATKVGSGGNVKNLKAGESYVIKLAGTITPSKCTCRLETAPGLWQNGQCSLPAVWTPVSGTLSEFLFTCHRDVSLDDVGFGVRVMSAFEDYRRWE